MCTLCCHSFVSPTQQMCRDTVHFDFHAEYQKWVIKDITEETQLETKKKAIPTSKWVIKDITEETQLETKKKAIPTSTGMKPVVCH